ncbi:monodechloroaminopyrrolnitrin synthase PrnB family protein [Streptomyces sp. NPDC006602]|uniref:monodechloroaminopyrrolnitrin synthase PrnB family protein n=1 Tax=Streptomyces sp. NPDC006602 TaxID=3364751 RepID=UPI0036B40740
MRAVTVVRQDLLVPGDPFVADLDPLRFDGLLPAVWAMNSTADVNALVGLLRDLTPTDGFVAGLSPQACAATMRDLGILLGSLRRHGVQPTRVVPQLGSVLLELGARTGMVPRDTVQHYIGWNPTGSRERMYTGDRQERMLMASVRVTLPRLVFAVEECRRFDELDPHQPDFAMAAHEVVALIRSLEDAIDIVLANVTPEFFARTLRPYFEAVTVDGAEYLGPAAAHAPLYLVDLALWASDHGGETDAGLWRESARYGLPQWQLLYQRWARCPSVVTRVTSALVPPHGSPPSPQVRAAAEAVSRALRALLVFRGKHSAVARDTYAEEIRLQPLGSGGGSLELLDRLATLTRENATRVRQSTVRSREVRTSPGPAASADDGSPLTARERRTS